MAHGYTEGTGYMVREPSWHGLEGALLNDWPGSWGEARDLAKLHWEPEIQPVFAMEDGLKFTQVEGWNRIRRSDSHATLSIQPETYKVINNTEFGKFIEIILGTTSVKFEALFELWGGKKVVCLVRFPEPRQVVGDPSEFFTYLACVSRHDGQGGLKAMATNVRVVCANTEHMADIRAKDGISSWTIRHTENWGDKIEEVAAQVQGLFDGQKEYYDLASNLCNTPLSGRDYDGPRKDDFMFVDMGDWSIKDVVARYLPIGDDMGPRQQANRLEERQQVEDNYYSESCEGIRGTMWGAYQAFTEWADHNRRYRSMGSYTDRTLSASPLKKHALKVTRKLAGV